MYTFVIEETRFDGYSERFVPGQFYPYILLFFLIFELRHRHNK